MISALVFDLDDTLYPESDFVRSGFAAVGDWLHGEHGVAGFTEEAGRLFAAGARGRIFDEALQRLNVPGDPDLVATLVQVYRAHTPRLSLYPDAARAVGYFGVRCRLGLLTDGYAATQRNKVAALGIGKRFRAIVFTDDFGRECWKPSPVPFERIGAALEARPAECVYVGDNPGKDFVAPNRLGWLTVHLHRADGEYGRIRRSDLPEDHRAQHQIGSLDELAEVLW